MLRALRIPLSWGDLLKRTWSEVMADNCLGLAAQLAYYFFLALFPALLFMVAFISFLPFGDVMGSLMSTLGRVAPPEVLSILQEQLTKLGESKDGGLLTLGALGALWSTSSGLTAIIDTLNTAYDIKEARPWWKVRLVAIGLTLALALFVVVAFTLVVAGPALAEKVAGWFGLGAVFTWTWLILQWPVVFLLVALAIAIVYYFGPDAEQEWTWITPGSLVATLLWLLISIGFRIYVTNFGSYNATYGAIGGVIVLMLWFYLSGLALLVGAELNAEAEHASPYGKDPGEKKPGQRKRIGRLAERLWRSRRTGAATTGLGAAGSVAGAVTAIAMTETPEALGEANCAIDRELTPAVPAHAPRRARASDWLLSSVVFAEAAAMTYFRLRGRMKSERVKN